MTGEEVFCICKKPDTGKLMVGCDGCDDWFHFSCMKIPEKYKDLVFSFYCPYCQAGITGPAARSLERSELPRTIWKRKCRLHNCYKECQPNSKYCCEEHGELYMKHVLSKLDVQGQKEDYKRDLILRMARYAKMGNPDESFQKLGRPDFIQQDFEKTLDPELFSRLIANDERLEELKKEDRELQSERIPQCNQNIELLNRYLEWLNEVNNKLFAEDSSADEPTDGTISRKKKKVVRKKQRRSICGYSPDFKKTPPEVDEFVRQYDSSKVLIEGICTKLKCNKHHDWSAMLMQQYTNQLRSLQSHQERLALLINTRKEQLHVQCYEQLLRNKEGLRSPLTHEISGHLA